jgi:hypothetical protein
MLAAVPEVNEATETEEWHQDPERANDQTGSPRLPCFFGVVGELLLFGKDLGKTLCL